MPLYAAEWVGLDVGREGLWHEDKWMPVLEIISRHEGEDVYDPASPIYAELLETFPDDKWMSEVADGVPRPLFRDYRHPWTKTGTIDIDDHAFHLTDLGRQILSGEVLRATAFQRALTEHEETGEYPFRIMAQAFLEADFPLSLDDLYFGIMQNYRPGDDLDEALLLGEEEATVRDPTRQRRLLHMLSLLEETGTIQRSENQIWVPGDEEVLRRIAAGVPPEEPLEPEPTPSPGTPYRKAREEIETAEHDPIVIDPDTAGAGRVAHNHAQNELANSLTKAGYTPLSPKAPLDPPFDVAWEREGSLFVAEVKSLSDSNEAQQIRLGIGQVLDYKHQFSQRGIDAVPVLAVERRPRDDRWSDLCDYLDVRLVWPADGTFPVPES